MNEIQKLLNECKFNSAKKYCEDIINKSQNNLENKIYYENELKNVNKYYNEFITNYIGETFLPLVNIHKGEGLISKIKVSDSSNLDIIVLPEWNNLISTTIDILKLYLSNEFPELLIFEWNLSNIKCGIKKFSFINYNYNIEGNSYKLPLLLAIISYLIGKEIPNEYCFTGDIEKVGNKYLLKKVDGIEEKLNVIRKEFPNIKHFIYPEERGKDLCYFIEEVFGSSLKEIYKSHFVNRYILIEQKSAISKYGVHKLVCISQGNIRIEEFSEVNSFIKNNLRVFKDNGQGVILDGRAPIALYSMIVSAPEIINSMPNFIALNYPGHKDQDDSDSKTAIVIKTSNSGSSKLKAGDYFSFKEINNLNT